MDISHATIWWVAAGLTVALELATGTFYLLMIASGLVCGGLAALLGLGGAMQIAAAAIVGSGATALWHWKRMQHPRSAPARENRDVNLDIGETVQVIEWAADRTARVAYRGTAWTARLKPGCTPSPGLHRVIAVEGNWLVVAPEHPFAPPPSSSAPSTATTHPAA